VHGSARSLAREIDHKLRKIKRGGAAVIAHEAGR
jgi:hypothetical protein